MFLTKKEGLVCLSDFINLNLTYISKQNHIQFKYKYTGTYMNPYIYDTKIEIMLENSDELKSATSQGLQELLIL